MSVVWHSMSDFETYYAIFIKYAHDGVEIKCKEGIIMANRLKDEKSPYLLQHKDNPVEWYPWCEEAFKKAKEEDKPVFLSIGYSTCHWCHVMAHESFEDKEAAELLNRGYVSIKVDREERPDIDAVYMSVCQAVTGSGGWPLTVIMTPEQKPFFAGTYFPRERYYGRPGLLDILREVLVLWKERREELFRDAEEITAMINKKRVPEKRISSSEKEILKKAYQLFGRAFDPVWGGFGSAPKFPAPHNLLFLMRYAKEEQEAEALRMAEVTLNAMADGGMYDQIGGGFSRYSTDERWLVPHFEKMLYDNALLILAYLEAYQITGEEKYAGVVRRTADYILRELTDEQGGFYCGQDADSDGVEGKYYVFTPKEVETVLGREEGRVFCRQYGITEAGNFEGKSIPNRIGSVDSEGKSIPNRISGVDSERKSIPNRISGVDSEGKKTGIAGKDTSEEKMYEYRLKRTSLHKDDKILLSWNAWTILALTRSGIVLGEKRYLDTARRAQRFIEEYMTDENDRLYLRYRGNEAAQMGQLEDYAVYALALLELYQAGFQTEYLTGAIRRAEQMVRFFEDKESGGYYINASDAVQLIARPKEMYDGAMPSGNSVAAMVTQKLAILTGDVRWQEAARRQMDYCLHEIREYPAGYSFTLLAMAEAVYPHRELVCTVGKDVMDGQAGKMVKLSDGRMGDLVRLAIQGVAVLVKTKESAEELAECAPFTKEYPLPKEGNMYYLCEDGVCREPVREIERLRDL